MPRKRQIPNEGYLGILTNPQGGYSTELNTTIEDPNPAHFGRYTNTPLLFPGQVGTDAILAGAPITVDQFRKAIEFLVARQKAGAKPASYGSVEHAVRAAERRHVRKFEQEK